MENVEDVDKQIKKARARLEQLTASHSNYTGAKFKSKRQKINKQKQQLAKRIQKLEQKKTGLNCYCKLLSHTTFRLYFKRF